ncbi:hypothetical protein [Oceanicoccus sagamiensis]|uniref:SbsA Ig-like domain-containing protein n=1 Tax=Oceanicoccus sagamiensis TaxID=716816 RepID=A0A1X9NCF3_9GAMM|nr:hypothetical protein [Oceanicoccus sagamiensis]ARN72647.1 hypothetical protein BST96_00070 [Oceanicoccus sagamiensis]
MTKKKSVIYSLLILSISWLTACGGGGGGSSSSSVVEDIVEDPVIERSSVLGDWQLTDFAPECDEFFLFGNNDSLLIASDQELVLASYTVFENPDGRDELEILVEFDNGLQDCEGDNTDDTGLFLGGIYVEFNGATMTFYDAPQGGELLATFEYFGQRLEELVSPNNALSVVSIDPSSAPEDVLTQFTVTVSYDVSEDLQIRSGFNDIYLQSFSPQNPIDLTAGDSGEVSFVVEGTPYDWGEGNIYYLSVGLYRSNQSVANVIREIELTE